MKRIRWLCILIAAVLLLNIPVGAEEAEDLSVTGGCHGPDAAMTYLGTDKLISNVGCALLYEYESDTMMYAWEADAPMYPSSFVKIMTGLLAVESGKLDETVEITVDMLSDLPGGVANISLQPGEKLTVRQLLNGMLVGSGNDAAVSIAWFLAGTQQAFVDAMNVRAAELGCTGTHYVNATGLHSTEQVTTARDTVRILSAALKNQDFYDAWSAETYVIPAQGIYEERLLQTNNFLRSTATVELYYDSRVTGGRTGVIETGERNIAVTAEDGGLKYIAIVMNSASTLTENGRGTLTYGGYVEAEELLKLGFSGYKRATILYDGQALKQVSVQNGNSDLVLGSKSTVGTVLPEAVQMENLTYKFSGIDSLTAPIEADAAVGYVEVWYGNICVAQSDLFALNRVVVAGTEEQEDASAVPEEKQTSVKAVIIKGVLITSGVALLIFVLLKLAVFLRKYLNRKKAKRFTKYRRRSR